MRDTDLEDQLAALRDRGIGPLSWWRRVSFTTFSKEAAIVESAAASIIAQSRLAPPELIAELATAREDDKAPVWNDLADRFFELDSMQLGLSWEIGGTCCALAAMELSPLGLVMLMKTLSEPYILMDPQERLWVASTWLESRGTLLNRAVLSEVDWWQSARGYQAIAESEDGE